MHALLLQQAAKLHHHHHYQHCSSVGGAVPALSQHQYSVVLSHASSSVQRCLHNAGKPPHHQTTLSAVPPERIVDVRAASSCNTSSSSSSSSSDSSSSSSTASSVSTARPAAFKKHGITGDGSCMFRACVQGHYYAQHGRCMPSAQELKEALQLRKDVVQALADSREEMEPFLPGIADDFDGYLKVMSQPGVWGGEPELLMASRVLKRPICVYQPTWSGPQHIVTYNEDLLKEAVVPMHLLWSGAHYDLLLPQAGEVTSKL